VSGSTWQAMWGGAPAPRRRRRSLANVVTYVTLCAAALLWLAPVLLMVVASLKPEDRVLAEAGTLRGLVPIGGSFENYRDVFGRVAFARILFNTVIINAGIVLGGLAVNSIAGYALARLEWSGRRVALAFVLALLIVPFEAVAVPLFYGTTLLGWRDTYLVQIAPFVANALSIYLFYTFFLGMPREVEDAARVDGAGPWRVFLEIVAPQSRSAFATVAIVTFLLHWGLYLWPLLVTSRVEVRPLPLGIAAFRTLPPVQWGDVMAFAVLMVAPVVVVFVVLQRWFVKSVAATGVKG
jgi:multiple sugar transport system permease protein